MTLDISTVRIDFNPTFGPSVQKQLTYLFEAAPTKLEALNAIYRQYMAFREERQYPPDTVWLIDKSLLMSAYQIARLDSKSKYRTLLDTLDLPIAIDFKETRLATKVQYDFDPIDIPTPGSSCSICQRPWTMEDVITLGVSRKGEYPDFTYEHPGCQQLTRSIEEENKFRLLFMNWGPVLFSAVPNQYWPEKDSYTPDRTAWYEVQTLYGTIKIGWRKSVISIDWSSTPFKAAKGEVQTEQWVTQDATYVHAYGYAGEAKSAKACLDRLLVRLKGEELPSSDTAKQASTTP